jgi:hypothetical protein
MSVQNQIFRYITLADFEKAEGTAKCTKYEVFFLGFVMSPIKFTQWAMVAVE